MKYHTRIILAVLILYNVLFSLGTNFPELLALAEILQIQKFTIPNNRKISLERHFVQSLHRMTTVTIESAIHFASGNKVTSETSSPAFCFLSISLLYVVTYLQTALSSITLPVVQNFIAAQQLSFSIAYLATFALSSGVYTCCKHLFFASRLESFMTLINSVLAVSIIDGSILLLNGPQRSDKLTFKHSLVKLI